MEGESEEVGGKRKGFDRKSILVGFVLPLFVAAVLFGSMFGFALKYHWMDQSMAIGPVTKGSISAIVNPDGGSFSVAYNAEGGGLTHATNETGQWVARQLTTQPVTMTSIFVDPKGITHIAAVNLTGALLYANNSEGGWNVTTVATEANPDGGCALQIDSTWKAHIAYARGAGLMYAEGRDKNWTNAQIYQKGTQDPDLLPALAMKKVDIAVDKKGNPYVAGWMKIGWVVCMNRWKGHWNQTLYGSNGPITLGSDADWKVHICLLQYGNDSATPIITHLQNTGANGSMVAETVAALSSQSGNATLTLGFDYQKRLHILYTDDSRTEYLVGSWGKTCKAYDLSPKVGAGDDTVVVDLSGFVYIVVEDTGPRLSLVTNHLTIWDQMRLNGLFTIVTGLGMAAALGLIGLNYMMIRRGGLTGLRD